MQVKSENQSVLAAEIKIIPEWAWVVAAIVFAGVQIAFDAGMAHDAKAPALWIRALLGVVAGVFGGGYLLFIVYINRDAKRRGMSAAMWTLLAILVPNALGIVLYFVLRQPLQKACPQCGNAVQMSFSFCPKCSYKLAPSCPQCQHSVGMDDVYCPYCGAALKS